MRFAVLCLLLAVSPASAATWAADVPLLDCDGLPCVQAKLGDGAMGLYGIDSGDVLSVVDQGDAAAIGFGADNMKDGQIAKAATTRAVIGGATLESVPAIAYPLRDDVARISGNAAGCLASTAAVASTSWQSIPTTRSATRATRSRP